MIKVARGGHKHRVPCTVVSSPRSTHCSGLVLAEHCIAMPSSSLLQPCYVLLRSCYVLLIRSLRFLLHSLLQSPFYILLATSSLHFFPSLPPFTSSSPVYTFSRKYNNNRWHYSPRIGSDLRPPLFDCGGRKRNTPRGRRAEHQTTVPVLHSVQKHPRGGGLSGTASRHGPSPLSYIL